jgi:hypothetical protein
MPIYVFQLHDNKKYVYCTDVTDIDVAMKKVIDDFDSMWIVKYNPQRVVEFYPDCDEWDYENAVLNAMAKYGIDNVRGGSYKQCDLSEDDMTIAKRHTQFIKTKHAIMVQKIFRGYKCRIE